MTPSPLCWLLIPGVLCSIAHAEDAVTSKGEQPRPEIVQVSEDEFRLGEIEFNASSQEIRIPGEINQTQHIIEFVLVHEMGKTHESLFSTPVRPLDLNVVLKLLDLQSGRGPIFDHMYPDPSELPPAEPLGAAMELYFQLEGEEPRSVCDLIHDLSTDEALKPQPWNYTGSLIRDGKFRAEQEGSIVALYLAEGAIFNMIHIHAFNDENWYPLTPEMPEVGTPVTLIFRPQSP